MRLLLIIGALCGAALGIYQTRNKRSNVKYKRGVPLKFLLWLVMLLMIFWIPELGVFAFIGLLIGFAVKKLWNKPCGKIHIRK